MHRTGKQCTRYSILLLSQSKIEYPRLLTLTSTAWNYNSYKNGKVALSTQWRVHRVGYSILVCDQSGFEYRLPVAARSLSTLCSLLLQRRRPSCCCRSCDDVVAVALSSLLLILLLLHCRCCCCCYQDLIVVVVVVVVVTCAMMWLLLALLLR
jgi:hypothetical protein